MLKRSIALEFSGEVVVREYRFVTAFGDDGEIVQILKEFLVFADGQNDCRAVAMLIREVLQGLAHGWRLRFVCSDVEDASNGYPTSGGSKSGLRCFVRSMACSRRQRSMFAWFPLSSMSGIFQPRYSGGRV